MPSSLLRAPYEIMLKTGVPLSHQVAFQEVADMSDTVIMSREVGYLCTTLIEEGYASKGFHIKAKSCDFGPMAGFVLEDPQLTKNKNTTKQRKEIFKALNNHHATSAPIAISENRRLELLRLGMIAVVKREGRNGFESYVVRANGMGKSRDGSQRSYYSGFQFRLIRLNQEELQGQNAPSNRMFAIEYLLPGQSVHVDHIRGSNSNLVHGLINPKGLGGTTAGVRATVCGDYDLFSTAVSTGAYNPGGIDPITGQEIRGKDARLVSINLVSESIQRLGNPHYHGARHDLLEDKHLGNISGRLREIRDLLNVAFRAKGYAGGNMVHHSDEAGRPLVDDVDLPVFAVVPGQPQPFALMNLDDLREFLHLWIGQDYVFSFNPKWARHITSSGAIFAKAKENAKEAEKTKTARQRKRFR